MSHLRAILISIICVALTQRLAGQSTPATAPLPPSKPISWLRLLDPNGQKFSLYFTFEYDNIPFINAVDATGHGLDNPMVMREVTPPPTFHSAAEFLEFLRQSLPEVEIGEDKWLPGVFHIREKTLLKRAEYLLNQSATLEFKGNVATLIAEVTRRFGDGFVESTDMTSPGARFDSRVVDVEVDMKNAPLYTILSAALPHWNNRLLWTAQATERNGKVIIAFKPSPSSRPATLPAPTTASRPNTTLPVEPKN